MGLTKSTEKILEFIEKQDKPITKTRIVEDLVLSSDCVLESIRFLEKLGKIQIITNGKTSFIMLKQNVRLENARAS